MNTNLIRNPRLPCTSLPEMDLNKWRTNDKHCMIGGQMILLGRYGRLSPCVNCLCSVEGVRFFNSKVYNNIHITIF